MGQFGAWSVSVKTSNRTIWMMWHQGFAEAPQIVRIAVESWRLLNPDWRIIVLDRNSLSDWVDLESVIDLNRSDLTVQKISNITRLCLLRRYGGVWADATVCCLRPLDAWLPEHYGAGFFAFRNPGPDRLASNWLIAAERDNLILVALYEAFLKFMNDNAPFSNQNNDFGRLAISRLSPILNRTPRRTIRWLSPVLQKHVRAYPYFIFHYTFNKVILSNPELYALWGRAKPLDAEPAHRLQVLAGVPDGLAQAVNEIDAEHCPVQKLNWRVDVTSPYWSGVLTHLTSRCLPEPPRLSGVAS
jgi:hypothetical protein